MRYGWLPLILLITACSHQPPFPGQKVGSPYVVDGKTYYPEADSGYDEIGQASWYGPGFHGKSTASGETYDQNDLTAAHPTLPLPSLVRVTNLENGRSLIVRINDRGPFTKNRLIDLSKRAAERLGIRSTAKVRVQYLKSETETYIAGLKQSREQIDMVAYNEETQAREQAALAAPEPPPSQIVESTSEVTHAGQAVSEVAPVMSVGENDLVPVQQASSPVKAAPPNNTVVKAPHSISLVKNAWAADDTVTPEPQPQKKHLTVGTPKGITPHVAPAKGGIFTIQAGVFSSEENARKLAETLKTEGSVSVDKLDRGAKPMWRVRVGSFAQKQDADAALSKVQGAGVADARVVRL